jgi:hypothetical protein
MSELRVVIVTDCGSTTTKAILIELRDGVYRQTCRGEAPTTVEAPFEDVTRGVPWQTIRMQGYSGLKMRERLISHMLSRRKPKAPVPARSRPTSATSVSPRSRPQPTPTP